MPHPTDKHVGFRVRQRRMSQRISQPKLGAALGVSFQQVQKYENGANRIGASNLYGIAKALKVEVGYFFDGLEETGNGKTLDAFTDPHLLRLGGCWAWIPDKIRKHLIGLAEAAARASGWPGPANAVREEPRGEG